MRTSLLIALPLLAASAVVAAFACSSSSNSEQGASCQTLATCCVALPSVSQAACLANAGSGNTTTCENELTAYQVTGLCGSTGSSASSAPALSGCVGLAACCAVMPAASAVACNAIVNAGVSAECSSELAVDEAAGQCSSVTVTTSSSVSPTGTACSSLSLCCAAMSGTAQASCDDVVSGGSNSTCAAELGTYESVGLCSSVGTGTGTGSFSFSTGTTQTSTQQSTTASSTCATAPKLFPEAAPGIYCPGVKTDAGVTVTCAAHELCCEDQTVDGGTPSTCSTSSCPPGNVTWTCLGTMDCQGSAAGAYCCGTGTVTPEPACGIQPAYDFISGFAGTTCGPSCPSWTMCESATDCPAGQTCVPARALGSDFGVCSAS